eukprot:6137132-Prymnesium_polylepis.1
MAGVRPSRRDSNRARPALASWACLHRDSSPRPRLARADRALHPCAGSQGAGRGGGLGRPWHRALASRARQAADGGGAAVLGDLWAAG